MRYALIALALLAFSLSGNRLGSHYHHHLGIYTLVASIVLGLTGAVMGVGNRGTSTGYRALAFAVGMIPLAIVGVSIFGLIMLGLSGGSFD